MRVMKAGRLNAALWLRVARQEAWHRQDHLCKYCTSKIAPDEITADHVVPRSKGGTDHANIVAACARCNRANASIPAKKFMQMVKGNRPTVSFRQYLCGVRYRLNRRTDKAVTNILAVA